MSNDFTVMNAKLIHETANARLLEFPEEDVKTWVPKSEKVTGEVDVDEEGGEIEIANWFLRNKNLID